MSTELKQAVIRPLLKVNCGKTEIIVFSSSYRPRPALNNLVIASDTVDCSTTAKNIGVFLNNSLPIRWFHTLLLYASLLFFIYAIFLKFASLLRYVQNSN